jgi:hypothetical protein
MHISGTLMADGIAEYVFGAVPLEQVIRDLMVVGRLPPSTSLTIRRPFVDADYHWLLRSMVLISVVV